MTQYPSGPPGRDPFQSFEKPAPQPVSIEQFSPPKRNGLWIGIGLVCVLTLLAVVYFVTLPGEEPEAKPTPTSTPTAAPSPTKTFNPEEKPGSFSIPIEGPMVGTWYIERYRWTENGLIIQTRLEVSKADGKVAFFCYDTNNQHNLPQDSTFTSMPLHDGDVAEGQIWFQVPPGDTTIYLSANDNSYLNKQVSAIRIPGP